MLKTPLQSTGVFLRQSSSRKFFALLALVALGGWLAWLGDTSQPSPITPLPQTHGEPDYYLEKARVQRFDEQGRHYQTLHAEVVTHYPEEELAEAENLQVDHWTAQGDHWRLTAQVGELMQNQQLLLRQEVRLQPQEPENPATPEFLTQRLWLNSQEDLAHTQDEVLMQGSNNTTRGQGLLAELDSGRIQLLEDVQTLYYPRTSLRQPQDSP
ncbi:LPS export ABC transporter periplasmic protein LptC [Marinospirillum perlucidum]|uniref:LPS export ABC transporter periplasmic protein LptC n=1 Tax=Marinospirillum perlucidum TaxID=1982602 RepID=UPI000DF3C0A5|nr:LPS export ABC transporter periplasmic protein LptC [Marinospirillum perlucidum]